MEVSSILFYVKVPEPFKGGCVKENGARENLGVKKLNTLDIDTIEKQRECFDMCRKVPGVNGCSGIWGKRHRGCYAHTQVVSKGNDEPNHICWIFARAKIHGKADPGKIDIKGKMLGVYFSG